MASRLGTGKSPTFFYSAAVLFLILFKSFFYFVFLDFLKHLFSFFELHDMSSPWESFSVPWVRAVAGERSGGRLARPLGGGGGGAGCPRDWRSWS